MPETITIESLPEFKSRHGCTPERPGMNMVPLGHGGEADFGTGEYSNWYLCPDGARYTRDDKQRSEPPNHETVAAKLRLQYLEYLLLYRKGQVKEVAANFRQQVEWFRMNSANPPSEDQLTALAELKQTVANIEAERDAAYETWHTLHGPTKKEKQEQSYAERRSKAFELLRKLGDITQHDYVAEAEGDEEFEQTVKEALKERIEKQRRLG